jgi:hypothetical protein
VLSALIVALLIAFPGIRLWRNFVTFAIGAKMVEAKSGLRCLQQSEGDCADSGWVWKENVEARCPDSSCAAKSHRYKFRRLALPDGTALYVARGERDSVVGDLWATRGDQLVHCYSTLVEHRTVRMIPNLLTGGGSGQNDDPYCIEVSAAVAEAGL